MKTSVLLLSLLAGVSTSGAATLTVGPHGQYATPCAALHSISDGDSVFVDANNGIPYTEPADPTHRGRSDCRITNSHLTIKGINGTPILDATGELIEKGIFVLDGHDITVDNFEFRNANDLTNPTSSNNAAGIRIEDGSEAAPAGGNITVRHCYIHDNGDGILSGNAGPGVGAWFSPNPYLLFDYDNFAHNGIDGDGHTHNMYIGAGGNMDFTLRNSVSIDAVFGHTLKSRAPINHILYNRIGDASGKTSYILNFPLGGTTFIIGNVLYKTAVTDPNANPNFMVWRDVYDNAPSDPEYGPPHEDLHFIDNFVVDDNPSSSDAFVAISCALPSSDSCAAPANGPVLTTPAYIKGNVFTGQPIHVTNQPNARVEYNLVVPFTKVNPAAQFMNKF